MISPGWAQSQRVCACASTRVCVCVVAVLYLDVAHHARALRGHECPVRKRLRHVIDRWSGAPGRRRVLLLVGVLDRLAEDRAVVRVPLDKLALDQRLDEERTVAIRLDQIAAVDLDARQRVQPALLLRDPSEI